MTWRWFGLSWGVLVACLGACRSEVTAPVTNNDPGELLRGKAVAIQVDLAAGTARVRGPEPPTAKASFALLGRNEISASITNLSRSRVGEFTPSRVRVRFDLILTNRLVNSDLVPSTFPAPPAPQVVAFPFATEPAGLFGLKVVASSDWNGTGATGSGSPHNFFNDAICVSLTPPGDCFRWEAFGAQLAAGGHTRAQRVGFDVDPTVSSFTLYVAVAADIRERAAAALIGVSETAPVFAANVGGVVASRDVTIRNLGGGSLTGLQAHISYPAGQPSGWLSLQLSSTEAPARVTLAPSVSGLAQGTYLANVAVSSPDAANSPVAIAVLLTVGQPLIAASNQNLNFLGSPAGPPTQNQTVEITSRIPEPVSGLEAHIVYGGEAGWLTATLSSTTTPATLTLSADGRGRQTGTYSAQVIVTSPLGTANPISVTFRIQLLPDLQFTGTPTLTSGVQFVRVQNLAIINQAPTDGPPVATGPFQVGMALCRSPVFSVEGCLDNVIVCRTPVLSDESCAAEASQGIFRPSLQAGQVDLLPEFEIRGIVPGSITPGSYYVIAMVDPPLALTPITEADETNNVLVLGPVEVN
jgi:hypothetical protein